MAAILFRIALITAGLVMGQVALDSVARNESVALVELGLALVLLVAGSAGFMVPLLSPGGGPEVGRHV